MLVNGILVIKGQLNLALTSYGGTSHFSYDSTIKIRITNGNASVTNIDTNMPTKYRGSSSTNDFYGSCSFTILSVEFIADS